MQAKLVAVAAAMAVVSGCAFGDASGPADGEQPIRVGSIPVSDLITVYIAQDQGFFDDEGLQVEIQKMDNAAAVVPAVMNGQLQVGTTANVPFLTAKAKGVPITAISNGANTSGESYTDYSGVFVPANSDIRRPRDLEGHTVTTNNLQNVLQLAVAESVAADGGDPSKVEFVAVPFPNMASALTSGEVDAISVVEPFYSSASGARLLDHPYTSAFSADTTLAFYFASEKWLAEEPEQARDFVEALDRAGGYAADHPEAVRDALVDHLGMTNEQARSVRLPVYGSPLDTASLKQTADLMVEHGFVDTVPDEDGLAWRP
jgi:NitT/TauT family transport system substrate-binding protein